MKQPSLKNGILLITYAIVLYLVLSNIGLVAGAGSYVLAVLRPVIIGVVTAYIINLLMRPMETKWLAGLWRRSPRLGRSKRAICIVLSILGVLAIITGLCFFILPQVGESLLSLANNIPGYITEAGDFFNGLEDKLDMENEVIRYLWDQGEELLNQSGTLIKNFVGGVAAWLLSFVAGLASGIINGFLGLIFAIYILADKEHLNYIYHRLLHAIFKDSVRERIEYIVRKIDRAFSGFFSGMLVEACILGSLCFVGLTIIGFFVGGMPYTLLISVLVGMCNMIPILGAYLSAIPSALLILLISPIKALIFVIFLVVVQQFEGNVIYPKVVGTSIGIGGMWVLFALTVGGNLMGIPGMVLGIPAFAVIYALVREFCDKRVAQKEAAGVAPAAEPAEQTDPAEEEESGNTKKRGRKLLRRLLRLGRGGAGGEKGGEGRGAARFGGAETRRRSLRQPPQAAGAAPRCLPPAERKPPGRAAGGQGVISGQKSGREGQQASSLWMVRAARRVPAATARARGSPRVSPETTPEKKASPAPVESTISTRWAGQWPASPVMLS